MSRLEDALKYSRLMPSSSQKTDKLQGTQALWVNNQTVHLLFFETTKGLLNLRKEAID